MICMDRRLNQTAPHRGQTIINGSLELMMTIEVSSPPDGSCPFESGLREEASCGLRPPSDTEVTCWNCWMAGSSSGVLAVLSIATCCPWPLESTSSASDPGLADIVRYERRLAEEFERRKREVL